MALMAPLWPQRVFLDITSLLVAEPLDLPRL